MLYKNINELNRQHCGHFDYVSQDFCQYQGTGGAPEEGLQSKVWNTTSIDLVSDITAISAPATSAATGPGRWRMPMCCWA